MVRDSLIVSHNHRKVSIPDMVLYIATNDHEDDRIHHETNDKPKNDRQHASLEWRTAFSYGDIRACCIIDSHHMFEKFRSMTIAILSIEPMRKIFRQRFVSYSIIMCHK